MLDDSELCLCLIAVQPKEWPCGHPILISAPSSSSSAASSRHFPFGSPAKRWRVQRHIGFHYFHSYESATLDSSQAVMGEPGSPPAPLPPTHTHIQTHSTPSARSPWKPVIHANENELILQWACDPSPFGQWKVLCKWWLTSLVSIKQQRAGQLIMLPL